MKEGGLTNRVSHHHLALQLTPHRGGLEEQDAWWLGGVAQHLL
jgi:hypothetical protein